VRLARDWRGIGAKTFEREILAGEGREARNVNKTWSQLLFCWTGSAFDNRRIGDWKDVSRRAPQLGPFFLLRVVGGGWWVAAAAAGGSERGAGGRWRGG
jgi:hypothetical protein